ncbi:hypothetical protein TGMAS_288590 [Toxoplasma gondii MAS]|uniref:Uncharacterized protein n=2 Tax=Toxoplasma gondii TaxID=5811 RepID=A0A086QHQ5_TOXGO|nr:hypothetical protein TGMAS_288590 [Toxoplasma gondii MAS]PUA90068.1 hypothetical protein TGBR9_288590 [Toxoplasma gondii TgCATBr9]
MRTKTLAMAFVVCMAATRLGNVTADEPANQEQHCCVPHDASGEKELAKAIRTAVAMGSHQLNAEAALARELANEADSKLYKDEDKKLVAAEKKAALANEAEEDARHELREEEEKDKHEEAEMSAVSQERVAAAKNLLQHEGVNLEKLVAEEEELGRKIEEAKYEGESGSTEAERELNDTQSFFLALRKIKGPHHMGMLVA